VYISYFDWSLIYLTQGLAFQADCLNKTAINKVYIYFMLPNKAGPAMTENLAKYLPFALRVGVDNHLVSEQLQKKIIRQNQVPNSSKDHFLVDEKFSLRLDEII
jgi:hypothetical protein